MPVLGAAVRSDGRDGLGGYRGRWAVDLSLRTTRVNPYRLDSLVRD